MRSRRISLSARNLLVGLFVASMALAACSAGGNADDEGTVEPDNTPATTLASSGKEPGSNGGGSSGPRGLPGGSGTVTINGESIEPAWVGNCIIDERFSPQPGDLDLTVSLDGGLDALFLRVSMRDVIGLPSDANAYTYTQFSPELQLRSESGSIGSYDAGPFVNGPDGTWYLDEIGNVPMLLALGRPYEGIVLDPPPLVIDGDNVSGAVAFEGEEGPIDVAFDLTIADPVDCSL